MNGLMVNRVCWCCFLTYLVFFSLASVSTAVSFDLTELRDKVAKIKVNPPGNLWARGHLMGKKSVMESPLLSSTEAEGVGDLEVSRPQGRSDLSELFQEFLRMQAQAHVDSQESRLKSQEAEMLLRILEIYTQRK
ncbi:neuromedin Bb [Festucalex cinctus]